MAEPLKNRFGPDVPVTIASMMAEAYPAFDRKTFLVDCLDGYDALELTPRARRISDALATHLPPNRDVALGIVIDSLGDEDAPAGGMGPFVYLPHVYFVAEHGLDHFELAMTAQYELTKRFTAEFSIRAYLEHHRDRTLARLRDWTRDPNVHVRRLVSESTRPRLPWAPRLKELQADPTPVIELLELLKDDPEEYVRRSVANNLNDIAKDHPAVVIELARRWWADGDQKRRRLVRHGLRTLIKQGRPDALDVLGYGPSSPARITSVTLTPRRLAIGEKLRIEARIENPTDTEIGALVDLRVHFVKSNGSTSPKVFKGAEVVIEPGSSATVRKTVSLAQHTTRTHYPGVHRVELSINGATHDAGSFELVAARQP
ncbi:MAG: DNA alkylation repair protein [Acidimicrobiia bacterium]|nr:DNA alkylation repair protein [Acidimicrobiia bacterium]